MEKEEIKQRLQVFLNTRLQEKGTINALMKMELVELDVEAKRVVLRFPVEAWQMNPAGNMHGGMICTALDISMGCVSYIFQDVIFTPTIQMAVNFVQGIAAGQNLLIEAILDHGGSRMGQCRAIARLEAENNVVASANGSYIMNTRK